MLHRSAWIGALALVVVLASGVTRAQMPDIPPPLPRKPPPKHASGYEPLVPELEDIDWGLDSKFLDPLTRKAEIYRAYARKFTCIETSRKANYDSSGTAEKEKVKHFGYLLTLSADGQSFNEIRQEIAKDGSIRSREVKDDQPFPPAYRWVYLFSRFYEPYFAYRYIEERFDGFDWVHEIQFKGSIPFTDGRDIRQWEGIILIDGVTHTPIEIIAEPLGQHARIEAEFRKWSSSFSFMGLKAAPRPFGHRAQVQFRLRRETLTFPTELRYDTFRAVGLGKFIPTEASTRSYADYRFTKVVQSEEIGDAVD